MLVIILILFTYLFNYGLLHDAVCSSDIMLSMFYTWRTKFSGVQYVIKTEENSSFMP